MDAQTPAPEAEAKAPSFFAHVGSLVWDRRWKLCSAAVAFGLGRLCPLGPEWLHPLCDLLARVLSVLGATP